MGDFESWIDEQTDPNPDVGHVRDFSLKDWTPRRVDRAAHKLACLSAGWARRGRALEDLVGVVYACQCHPKVMPRDELALRLAPGPLLDALTAARVERGRLAVVAAHGTRGPTFSAHSILVPEMEAPDTRGILGALPSADRRNELERRLEELKPKMFEWLAKELFDHRTLDALYLRTSWLEYGRKLGEGGMIDLRRRKNALSEDRPLLLAAELDVRPNKMLCVVPKEYLGEDDAIVWLDVARVGLRANANPCTDLRGSQHP